MRSFACLGAKGGVASKTTTTRLPVKRERSREIKLHSAERTLITEIALSSTNFEIQVLQTASRRQSSPVRRANSAAASWSLIALIGRLGSLKALSVESTGSRW
jgi:hypothetical protein